MAEVCVLSSSLFLSLSLSLSLSLVFRRLGTQLSAKRRTEAAAPLRAAKVLMKGEAIDPIRYGVSRFDLRPSSGRVLR